MIALEAKLAFLRQPGSYPERVYRVEAIETHLSWVFLTEGHAYKLKKPVNYGMPDFSTLEARRFFCDEEVRLNRRLAPDVYLASVPLAVDADGHLQIAGTGREVDRLVKMRRLPAQRMLDYLIRTGRAGERDLVRVAQRLAAFYRACDPAGIDPAGYRLRFERQIEQCRQGLLAPVCRLPAAAVRRLFLAQREALRRVAPRLDERAQGIVEGHGDLRAEHVCLEDEPVVIDCLEFSRELRLTDAIDEVAFLALECERFHAPALGACLLKAYGELSGDTAGPALIHFYQSVRAGLRALLAIRHLAEEQFRYSGEWVRRTRQYLDMAARHAAAV